jgi:hypothetical protein
MMTVADANTIAVSEEEQADIDERGGMAPHDVVVQVFESFVPSNVASAVANDELLAVLVSAVVVGCLIRGPDSSLLRAVREIEKIVMKIITFLIKLAPVGVFFLILSNLFKLDIADIGQNLGVLIGASLVNMAIHMFVVFVSLTPTTTSVSNIADFWISFSQFSTSSLCVRTGTLSGSNAHAPGCWHGPLVSYLLPLVVVVMKTHLAFAKLHFHNFHNFHPRFTQLTTNSLICRDHARHLASSSREKDPQHGRQLHHPARNAREHGRNSNLLPDGCGLPRSNARHVPQRWRLRHHCTTLHTFVNRHDPDSVVVAGPDPHHCGKVSFCPKSVKCIDTS